MDRSAAQAQRAWTKDRQPPGTKINQVDFHSGWWHDDSTI